MTRNARLGYSLVAGSFVAVVGNLNGMVQWWRGSARTARRPSRAPSLAWRAPVRLVTGLVATFSQRLPLPSFDYWRSTRLIPNTINEFPFFSYLFADLHAHMIGIPFTVLVLALALNLAKGGPPSWSRRGDCRTSGRGRGFAWPFRLCRFTGGAGSHQLLGRTHVPWHPAVRTGDSRVVGGPAGASLTTVARFIAIVGVALLLYAPFFQNYQALSVGIGLTTTRTTLADYWQMFGLFLFLVASYLVVEGLGGPGTLCPGPAAGRCSDGSSSPGGSAAWSAERGDSGGTVGGQHGKRGCRYPSRAAVLIAGGEPGALGSVDRRLGGGGGRRLLAGRIASLCRATAAAGADGSAGLAPRADAGDALHLLLVFAALLISLGVEVVYLKDFLGGGDYQRMIRCSSSTFRCGCSWVLPRRWRWRGSRALSMTKGGAYCPRDWADTGD